MLAGVDAFKNPFTSLTSANLQKMQHDSTLYQSKHQIRTMQNYNLKVVLFIKQIICNLLSVALISNLTFYYFRTLNSAPIWNHYFVFKKKLVACGHCIRNWHERLHPIQLGFNWTGFCNSACFSPPFILTPCSQYFGHRITGRISVIRRRFLDLGIQESLTLYSQCPV